MLRKSIRDGKQLFDLFNKEPPIILIEKRLSLLRDTWSPAELRSLINKWSLFCDVCNTLPHRDIPSLGSYLGREHVLQLLGDITNLACFLPQLHSENHVYAVLQILGRDGINSLTQSKSISPLLAFDYLYVLLRDIATRVWPIVKLAPTSRQVHNI